jgi:hypothetical protein
MVVGAEVRGYDASDRAAVLDLAERFTEFELPPWRSKYEIDEANRHGGSPSWHGRRPGEPYTVR